MAKLKTSSINETIKMLEKVGANTDEILTSAIEAGAEVVVKAMSSQISSLKTSSENDDSEKRYPTQKELNSVKSGLGFAPVKDNGSKMDTNIGFAGYDGKLTKKYPRGHSNKMLAAKFDKGTSFIKAQPFFNKAKKQSEARAIEAMDKVLTKEINKIMK